jgi:hypothetical protein
MPNNPKSPHTSPGASTDTTKVDDEMVNDSLGTTTIADSTGSDESKETGDAKRGNKKTRED